jgi:hypothetical protein
MFEECFYPIWNFTAGGMQKCRILNNLSVLWMSLNSVDYLSSGMSTDQIQMPEAASSNYWLLHSLHFSCSDHAEYHIQDPRSEAGKQLMGWLVRSLLRIPQEYIYVCELLITFNYRHSSHWGSARNCTSGQVKKRQDYVKKGNRSHGGH